MNKKFIIATILLAALFSFSLLLADEGQTPSVSTTVQTPATPPKKKSNLFDLLFRRTKEKQTPQGANPESSWEVPEWVKRTNFAIEAGSNQRPKYFMETIQPLFGTQHKEAVLFNQSRFTSKGSRPVYNTGLGLRKIFKGWYLLGINSFYDYQDLHKHSRTGVGFEGITDLGIEARVNTYIGISGRHLVNEDASNSYYEKVANGFDWEFGAPLPYLPFLKVYGGGNWYNFEHFKKKYGWKFRAEYTPIKYSRIDFEIYNDNKLRDTSYRFEGALTFAFTSFAFKDILRDIKFAQNAYPKLDLKDKVLDRVVRNFDITVISSIKSKGTGFTVEGGQS